MLFIAGTALLLVFIGLVLLWEANRTKEPIYKRRPLSYWLLGESCTSAETKEAVDHLGTNCIPTLLRMLQMQDSKAKRKLVALTYDQKFIRDTLNNADDAHHEAVRGFFLLGPRAQGAVAALIRLYDETPGDRKYIVAKALGAMGPHAKGAVPTFLHAMTSTNEDVRVMTSATLGEIGQNPDQVLPVMIKALSDPSESCRKTAAFCIACYGTNAASAVPALIATAKDPSASVRIQVLIALKHTHQDPQVVVPILTNALADTVTFESAARALVEFGTNSISAVPQLMMMAASTNANVRDFALITLGKLHLRPDITIPILIKTLGDSDYWMRAWAASGLGNFGNDAKPAVPALIDLYHHEQQQSIPYDTRKSERIEMIGTALLRIDPAAAAEAGINTNPPAL